MRALKRAGIALTIVAVMSTMLTGSAVADSTTAGLIDSTSPTAVVPIAGVEGSCMSGTSAYYVATSFQARATGTHHLRVTSTTAYPLGAVLYDGFFAPVDPLANCLRATFLPAGENTTSTLDLAAIDGHTYTVVLATIAMADYSLEIDEPDGAAATAALGTGSRFLRLPASLACRRLALNATWTSRALDVRSAVFFVDGQRVDLVRRPEPHDRSGVPVGLGDVTVKATLTLKNGKTASVRRSYLGC